MHIMLIYCLVASCRVESLEVLSHAFVPLLSFLIVCLLFLLASTKGATAAKNTLWDVQSPSQGLGCTIPRLTCSWQRKDTEQKQSPAGLGSLFPTVSCGSLYGLLWLPGIGSTAFEFRSCSGLRIQLLCPLGVILEAQLPLLAIPGSRACRVF